jgi:hypothetical protein
VVACKRFPQFQAKIPRTVEINHGLMGGPGGGVPVLVATAVDGSRRANVTMA